MSDNALLRAEAAEAALTVAQEHIARLRDALAERDDYIADLEQRLIETVERANAAEIACRRAALTPEQARKMLGAIMA